MIVIGGGKHRLPVRAIGGLSDEYVSSTVVLGNGEAAEVNPSAREVIDNTAHQSIYTHKLYNKTVTKADGKRYLVNEGTEGGSYALSSGQGIKFGAVSSISTGVALDITKDFTILWSQEKTVSNGQNGSIGTAARSHFGIDANGIRVGIGVGSNTVFTSLTAGKIYDFVIRYSATSKEVVFGFLDGSGSASFNIGVHNQLLPLFIGGIGGDGLVGIQKDFFYIPHYFTDQELTMHRQTPELTVYRKNGIVNSGFLSRPVLDAMQSGNGFVYLLNEEVESGDLAINLIDGAKKQIAGYSKAIRVGASNLQNGVQCALLTKDPDGQVNGLTEKLILEWDEKSFANISGEKISGSWNIDIYVKHKYSSVQPQSSLFSFELFDAADVSQSIISLDRASGSDLLRLNVGGLITIIDTIECVVSFERVDTGLNIYLNKVFHSSHTIAFDYASISFIGAYSASAGFASGATSGFITSNTKRTIEERVSQVDSMAKSISYNTSTKQVIVLKILQKQHKLTITDGYKLRIGA